MRNSGSSLLLSSKLRRRWEYFFFKWIDLLCFVLLYRSGAKEDGVLGRDSSLPTPVSFRLVRTGTHWWRKDQDIPTEAATSGGARPHVICMLHARCIFYVQLK